MMNRTNIKKTAARAAVIVIMITLAACGSSDKPEEKKCLQPGYWFIFPVCWRYESSTSNTPSTQDLTSRSNSESVGVDSASSPLVISDEYEPNNLLENANIVTLRAVSTDSLSGIEIIGSVRTSDDAADYFIFAPNRSSSYDIFLCGENCTEIRQSDAVYLMIYDQSQTTIASTPLGGNITQKLTVNLVAGLAYYIEVNGYNTADMEYDYRLIVTD